MKKKKNDRKHFYLAIRNEMFVHRMLWSRNIFQAFFCSRFSCVEGTYAPSFPVCETKASIFFFAELTSVGTCGAIWHMLQCISYCTCCNGWPNETTTGTSILSKITYSTFTSQSDSRGLVFSLSITFDSDFRLALDCCSVRLVQQGINWHRMLIRAVRKPQLSAKYKHRPANSRYRCPMSTINP